MGSATEPVALPGFVMRGEGQDHVLVLHDWFGDHTTYEAAFPYLDEQAFSYAFLDLRGYGLSRHLRGEHTLQEIVADCLAVADSMGWTTFSVIGHSLTGMAAQRLALEAPDRVQSAVVVCPMSAAGSPADDQALGFFARTITDDEAFLRLAGFLCANPSPGWARAKLRQSRGAVSPEGQEAYLKLFRTNFVDDIIGLETPFLVVVGDRDPGLGEAEMRDTFLAWHPNAELHVLRNCGHYPMQEQPPAFVAAVENFLAKPRRHQPSVERTAKGQPS